MTSFYTGFIALPCAEKLENTLQSFNNYCGQNTSLLIYRFIVHENLSCPM